MDTVQTDERNDDSSELPGGGFEILVRDVSKTQVCFISENDEKQRGESINLDQCGRSPKSPPIYLDEQKMPIPNKDGIRVFPVSHFIKRLHMPSGPMSRMEEAILCTTEQQRVVLKFIKLTDKKLLKEAEVFALLPKHENVLSLLGKFRESDELVLVSTRQDGDVREWIKTNPCPKSDFFDISVQMGRGLDVLHEHNIVHRDVALRNFLIKKLDLGINVKICDFGLSRVVPTGIYRLSEGSIIPWQHQGPEVLKYRNYDSKCDVYAFGVSIWELWSRGKNPFDDFRDIPYEQFVGQLSNYSCGGELLAMNGIPGAIQYLIRLCTTISTDERPTMKDMVTYLENVKAMFLAKSNFEKINIAMKKHDEEKEREGLKEKAECKNSKDEEKEKDKSIEKHKDKNYDKGTPTAVGEETESATKTPTANSPKTPTANSPKTPSESTNGTNDELLQQFFQTVLKPSSKSSQMDVQNYVDMCVDLGIERKSDLVGYLDDIQSAEEVMNDRMDFKKVHLTKILEALFEDSRAQRMKNILKPTNYMKAKTKTDDWDYISKPSKNEEKTEGPVKKGYLRTLFMEGKITKDSLLYSRKNVYAGWRRVADVPGLINFLSPRTPTPAPRQRDKPSKLIHCSPDRRYYYVPYPDKNRSRQGPTNTSFLRRLFVKNELNMFSLIYDNENPCFNWRRLLKIPDLIRDLDPTNPPPPSQPSNPGNVPSLNSNSSNPKKTVATVRSTEQKYPGTLTQPKNVKPHQYVWQRHVRRRWKPFNKLSQGVLEKAYLKSSSGTDKVVVKLNGDICTVDLQSWTYLNESTGIVRKIRRNLTTPTKVILKVIPTTSGIGKKIYHKFAESWAKKSIAEPASITILEIQNRYLSDRFLAHKKNVESECKSGQDVVREHVFHGSSTLCNFSKASTPGSFKICENSKCATCNITRVGFEVNRCATNMNFARFGGGIYFAENASKAHDYTKNVKAQEHRIIFVADLVVGNMKTYTTNQPQLKAPPDGFHSVFGKPPPEPSPQGALNYSENVVYRDEAALPTHCIHYLVVDAK